MKDLFNRIVLMVEEEFSRLRVRGAERRLHESEIRLACERVVDQVNPRLRAVGGYRKKLFPVVERAVEYAHELARQVPGPLQVNRKAWAEDPMVNALFADVQRLRWVLTGPEVRKYVKEHPAGDDCYAVLAVMPDVRQQLGMELVGDAVQRDVRQTTLSFADHEVALVGESEEEVRRAMGQVALDLLTGLAVQDIVGQEARVAELEERLRIVRIKRRVVDVGSRGAAFILDGSAEHLKQLDALEGRIAELERDLAEAKKGLEGLDDYLERLVARLEHPETHLSLERVRGRLDRMNIVRKDADEGLGAKLELTRARRNGQPARVVTIIRFPRSELLAEGERLREVERYLG